MENDGEGEWKREEGLVELKSLLRSSLGVNYFSSLVREERERERDMQCVCVFVCNGDSEDEKK